MPCNPQCTPGIQLVIVLSIFTPLFGFTGFSNMFADQIRELKPSKILGSRK